MFFVNTNKKYYTRKYGFDKMKYDIILWDLDNTLLDFDKAESEALKSLFARFNLDECSDEMVKRYSIINVEYWRMLERGEMSKSDILINRFMTFFKECGIDTAIVEDFNSAYQLALGDTIAFRDNSLEIVKSLKGKARQYIVSNGTIEAQVKKLKNSTLDKLMDDVFLSERLGAEKPSEVFFEKAFASIGGFDKARAIIIGDSLTSDIKGGKNAGITTCWYNPWHHAFSGDAVPDFEISHLSEVLPLLG